MRKRKNIHFIPPQPHLTYIHRKMAGNKSEEHELLLFLTEESSPLREAKKPLTAPAIHWTSDSSRMNPSPPTQITTAAEQDRSLATEFQEGHKNLSMTVPSITAFCRSPKEEKKDEQLGETLVESRLNISGIPIATKQTRNHFTKKISWPGYNTPQRPNRLINLFCVGLVLTQGQSNHFL